MKFKCKLLINLKKNKRVELVVLSLKKKNPKYLKIKNNLNKFWIDKNKI